MPDPDLAALAEAHGVATRYESAGRAVDVPVATLRAVLAALDVPAADAGQVRASLAAAASLRRFVEPTVVTGPGGVVRLRRAASEVAITTEDGEVLEPRPEGRSVRLPDQLGHGAHRLTLRGDGDEQEAHLLVVPPRCPVPEGLRTWGWQVQLYALRSRASWGIGDLGDLRTLIRAGAPHGAGMVLLNPLHAALPVLPQEPSPYYPASRRFTNPLYLRVEHCDGYDGLPARDRELVDHLAAQARADNTSDRIDRDAVFRRKTAAFELLARQPLPAARQAAFSAYRQAEGQGLVDFATACALAERHGSRDWPARLRDPRGQAVAEARAELAERVVLHEWLQWQCDEQLAAAGRAARDAGMPVGLVADLAVGVDPGGADAWALQADLAQGVTIGAPPDDFSQLGQNWQLPPLRPDRLVATGHAALRDLLRSLLRRTGALRIDHVLGLFRLFWIPEGAPASEGTYVRYPADDLLGVLALEAQAAGALIIGEDLGNVERGVRERLRAAGVLGSRVLWFERHADGRRLRSADYPERALTSVTTHDLPTAAGFLADEPTRVRAALGQLRDDEPTARRRAARERAELLDLLMAEGLLDSADAPPDAVLVALHAFVARTPSMLVTAGLNDAIGDRSQPNLPGTVDEYPNWRLPIADAEGRPMLLDDLLDSPEVARIAAVLRAGRDESG